jgi:hypothetical protein
MGNVVHAGLRATPAILVAQVFVQFLFNYEYYLLLVQFVVGLFVNYSVKATMKYLFPGNPIIMRPPGAFGTGLTSKPCRDDNDAGMFSGHSQLAGFVFGWHITLYGSTFTTWLMFLYSLAVALSRLHPKYANNLAVCKHGVHTRLQAFIGYVVGVAHAFLVVTYTETTISPIIVQ